MGRISKSCFVSIIVFTLSCVASGCANLNVAQEAGIVTAMGARSPTNEIQQIYYLGVFDPREQVPPTIYRVRVSGQASQISNVKFASGWVPAPIADSLSGQITFGANGGINIESDDNSSTTLLEGRTMMAFGPEGYRKAPKDHRLVIIMGQSPEDYFAAVDTTLGTIAKVRDANQHNVLTRKLLATVASLDSDQQRLDAIRLSAPGGVLEAAK